MTPDTLMQHIFDGLQRAGESVKFQGRTIVTADGLTLPIDIVETGGGGYPNLLAGSQRVREYRLYYGWDSSRKWMKVKDSMDLAKLVAMMVAWVKKKRAVEAAQDRAEALAKSVEVGTPGVSVKRSMIPGKVRLTADLHVTVEQARAIIAAIEGNTAL